MIRLQFIIGSATRQVIISKRKVSLLTAENNFVPLILDLDKIKEQKEQIKRSGLDQRELKKIARLKTEKAIAEDIIKDFKQSGWRLTRKSGIS